MARGEDLRNRHLLRLERHIERLERRSRAFSRGRLAFAIAAGLTVFWAFRGFDGGIGLLALALAGAGFTVVVKLHDRVDEALRQARLLRRIKEIQERRRALDWDALPAAAIPNRPNPYAADLNIVGERSLHHLLDACGSTGGSARLQEWLVDPAPSIDRIVARQRLVKQLVPLGLFRDHLSRLTLAGAMEEGARWDDRGLRQWLDRRDVIPKLEPWLIGLGVFAAVNVGLIVAHLAGWLPPLWAASLLIYFAIYLTQRRSVKHLFDEAQELDLTLDRVMPPLLYIERFRFAPGSEAARVAMPIQGGHPHERATTGTIAGDEPATLLHSDTPSTNMRRVRRIAAGAALTRSEFLWLVLNVLMPWDLLFTYLLHRARETIRDRMPAWLDAWYTLEAASSLAGYADIHPNRTFPTVCSGDEGGPVFHGRALGHPLIREEVKARNDFSAERLGGVFLITGSNMSGKSTFLRTLGVNLRLAYAGGAVDAAALETIPFRVLTSINVVDSIQEGLSHFYAEVRRLKELLDALGGSLPLFILIDEIFRGTNNRERLIGSRAYVRALAGQNAVSLVTTHDLELTQLEGEIGELRNFHFREDVSNGRMTFDYRLRPGPSPTTNALKIMKTAGLPVEAGTGEAEEEASSSGTASSSGPQPPSGPKSSSGP